MQFRRVIDYLEGICILHNDPGIAQNLEITEQKSELTITNLNVYADQYEEFNSIIVKSFVLTIYCKKYCIYNGFNSYR